MDDHFSYLTEDELRMYREQLLCAVVYDSEGTHFILGDAVSRAKESKLPVIAEESG